VKKLVLVETEMKGPKGHYLDNLIETSRIFKKKFNISWIVNNEYSNLNTYVPKNINIYRSVNSNKVKRKENKFYYLLEELYLFFINIFQIFYFSIFFLLNKKFLLFIYALKTNYFLLPRYFYSFYKKYKELKLNNNDHVFFQTARRKDIELIFFLILLDKNHPKFHIRVFLPPNNKFKGFFYYLKLIDDALIKKRAFIYLFSKSTQKLFLKNSISKKGIYLSNIPWSFYKRSLNKKKYVVGYVGNARRTRGFHLLPRLIKKINKIKSLFFLIQFSNVSKDLFPVRDELIRLSKNNKNIKIIDKYCNYYEFRGILKQIDIMPILNTAKEINKSSGTLYSCLTHEIPTVIPYGISFMKNIHLYKSYEKAKNLNQYSKCIIKITNSYNFYLKNTKLNSKILRNTLKNDPLRKNII
tara:strand:+ start:114 stop:1349 length:1236 start_codon:yes stop_codon:yes gene_type:complete